MKLLLKLYENTLSRIFLLPFLIGVTFWAWMESQRSRPLSFDLLPYCLIGAFIGSNATSVMFWRMNRSEKRRMENS